MVKINSVRNNLVSRKSRMTRRKEQNEERKSQRTSEKCHEKSQVWIAGETITYASDCVEHSKKPRHGKDERQIVLDFYKEERQREGNLSSALLWTPVLRVSSDSGVLVGAINDLKL